ncbi:diacylglycerol/lipid kinase family protein [Acetobacter ghanensis]|uniref:diacylglycerol/lipid kinase family protein n=1 Tax=Acetobacter ghanensis TaxID=431306 RepID=UPI003D346650
MFCCTVCRVGELLVYIIYNPTAGRRNIKKLTAVLDALTQFGISPQVLRTEYAGHATELARSVARLGGITIVAAGGDGTIAEVVSGIIGTNARLGLIPLGTANVMAREFGLPRKPAAIAKVLASSGGRLLWPGCLQYPSGTKQIFVQMASVGFDASVVHHVHPGFKKRVGRYAYVIQTIRDLFYYRFLPVQIEVDGKIRSVAGAIVSKGCFYGGHYLLTRHANPSERGFTIILFEQGGVFSVLNVGWALLRNRISDLPGVQIIKADQIKILTPEGIPLQADGDASGSTPVEISDAEAPIFVAAP